MKILRQKLFTFQDKKAWEELKAATNNFTTLPNGRGKMNARDVIRFKKWAELVDQRRMNEVDWNEAKKAFEHIGLPETAKGLEHLSHKYKLIQDPKFQNRYQDIMSGKEWRRGLSLYRNLSDRKNNEMRNNPLNAAEIENKYINLINKNQDRFDTSYKLGLPLLDSAGGREIHRDLYVKALHQNDRKNKKYDKRNMSHGRTRKFIDKVLGNEGVEMVKDAESQFIPKYPNAIFVSNYSPGTVLHEFGHQNSMGGGGYSNRVAGINTTYSGPLSILAEENVASSRALAKARQGIKTKKLNPKIEKSMRKDLESSFGGYLHHETIKALEGVKKAVRR